ncbi:hypothetical protein [Neptunomonas marina]|uniref:hypothetical protein n=1 Tax=Neptunomonas marina TaxID=1815562 RepID=UPI0013E299E6|nr:hypothetical protein [Neptunomonas marina]
MTFDDLIAEANSLEASASPLEVDFYKESIETKEEAFEEEMRAQVTDEAFMARTYTL